MLTPETAKHDRLVCLTHARWHSVGRIVSIHSERGPILCRPTEARPATVAIVQFQTDARSPYSGQRISVPLTSLTPRHTESSTCPTCMARDRAEVRGMDARYYIDRSEAQMATLNADMAASAARTYFRHIEEAS